MTARDPIEPRCAGSYGRGCRCDKCSATHRRKCKSYNARALAAGGSTTVDATEARAILTELAKTISLSALGRSVGTSHSWVSKVIHGHIERINPERNRAVLGLREYRPTDTSHVSALGTRRRLQALHAMGYTWARLAKETGYGLSPLKATVVGKWDVIEARNAEAVRVAYERLSMRLPEPRDQWEKSAIGAAKNSARRKGWPPPLAWNDPDDPTELPKGWQYEHQPRKRRHDTITDLDDQGAGIETVCRELSMSREAVEKWCARHDQRDLYRRLVERETPRYWANQWGEGGAA